MTDFKALGVDNKLVEALTKMGINAPTPVQAGAIPPALEGQDILASAQTGTGKTIAYLLPLLTHLTNNPTSTALVLTPTRELATQVRNTVYELLGKKTTLGTALLIGGDSMFFQLKTLKARPQLIVGTPGRINDHLKRRTLDLRQTTFLVLDETDRMLDMDFSEDLEKIAKYLPEKRQTLMFSATIPNSIVRIAAQYLTNPARISIEATTVAAPKIKQSIIQTSNSEKFGHLLRELDERKESIIIFVKTKDGARILVDKLSERNHSVDTIHGDLKQRNRERVIHAFRNQRYRIMVATDIAARGLDIPHIRHVINYDLPQCSEDYVHRIGRTGRAGAEGEALSLVSPDDIRKWKAIQRLLNPGEKFEEDRVQPRRSGGGGGRGPSGGAGGFKKKFGSGGGGYSRSERSSSDRPERSGSDRPSFGRSDKPASDRPHSSDRPARPSSDRPYSDRPARTSSDRPYSDRPARASSDRPYSSDRPERSGSDRPSFDRKPASDRFSRPERSSSDRPYSSDRPERSGSDRPSFGRSDKPASDRFSRPERPSSDRPYSDRPARSGSDKPSFGRSDKPYAAKPSSDRPSFGRSDKPASERFARADRPKLTRSDSRSDKPFSGKPGFVRGGKKSPAEDIVKF